MGMRWRRLPPFETLLSCVLVVFLTILLFVQIINRYVFSVSFVWLEEIARISFVWLIYFCVAAAARENSHIRVGLIDFILPRGAIRIVNILADILVVAFSAFVAWYGVVLMRSSVELGDTSPVTDIPMYIVYAVIPVCFLLIAYRVLEYHLVADDSQGGTDRETQTHHPVE